MDKTLVLMPSALFGALNNTCIFYDNLVTEIFLMRIKF